MAGVAPRAPREIKISYAIVGFGTVSDVTFMDNVTFGAVKATIRNTKPLANRCGNEGDLHLYLARRDGKWLTVESEEIRALRRCETPDMLTQILDNELLSTVTIANHPDFGEGFTTAGSDIHFLVTFSDASGGKEWVVRYKRYIRVAMYLRVVISAVMVVSVGVILSLRTDPTSEALCGASPFLPYVGYLALVFFAGGTAVGLIGSLKELFQSEIAAEAEAERTDYQSMA